MQDNEIKQSKILGFKTELYEHVSIVLPSVDVLIILLGGFTSENPWISVPLNILFPITGVSSVKIAEKMNSKWPVTIGLLLLAFIGGFLCYFSGKNSPAFVQAIPLITAILFLMNSKVLQIAFIVVTLVNVMVAQILVGQNISFILTSALTLAVVSAILERSFAYLITQQRRMENQKKIIEQKQKEILDSIRYAKRIQSSLMPTVKSIGKNLERLHRN